MDYTSARRLAATCQACAAEFEQQKVDLTERYWAEVLPTVIRDIPDQEGRYGYEFPVVLQVKWQPAQAAALRRIYAMRQNAGFLQALWRRALSQSLWTDLLHELHDDMPEAQPDEWYGVNHIQFDIRILIASDDFLRLPWSWLFEAFQYGPAAALICVLNTTGPQQPWAYDISLHRPARGGETQLIMHTCFKRDYSQDPPSEPYDPDDSDSIESWSWYSDYFLGDLYVRPEHRQFVAITGRWCDELPDANKQLSSAHYGCHLRGLTAGDDIAYHMDSLPDDIADDLEKFADGFDPQASKLSTSNQQRVLLECVAKLEVFKPYTCEMETSDWYSKRQSARSKGHAKMKRSGQAVRPASRKHHI